MADPSSYRPEPGQVPDSPGVYRFRDEHSRVIYVGKAKSLRARLANYFQPLVNLHPRTQSMVTTAASVEWTVVSTEVEALALEYSWIKEFDPRFNIKYRDDKSYPYLAVTMGEEFPRIHVMRGAKKPGIRYFGPYGHAWAIRETVDLLLRVFPVRTCSAGVFKRSTQTGRACLLGYIDKCSAPCVGRISSADHRKLASDFCDFMAGDTGRFIKRLESEMTRSAQEMEYERAARLRDDLSAMRRAMEKNAVVFSDATDADVFALAQDELEASAQVFFVRGGRIRGERGWIVEKVEDLTDNQLVEHLLQQVYGEAEMLESGTARSARLNAVPREVLVPVLPDDLAGIEAWLKGLRGAKVSVRIPQRGDKKTLQETVHRNALQALNLHKLRRSSDLTTRSQALKEIQEALDLDDAPLRIECFDISNLQQTDIVASMVVFEDGLPRKDEYRRFSITGEVTDGATDDTAAIYEVITRRFRNQVDATASGGDTSQLSLANGEMREGEDKAPEGVAGEAAQPETVVRVGTDGKAQGKRRFAYPPNLVVVDGGAPQVEAANAALADLGITDVALCGLAKRLEEVWCPGEEYPLILPRTSEGLYLLQRVRDEAHRFAITYHRKKRGKKMTASALDGVPGLGPARQRALLKKFGSVKRIRAATPEQIAQTPGIGSTLADQIHTSLAPAATSPSVNVTTGEILE